VLQFKAYNTTIGNGDASSTTVCADGRVAHESETDFVCVKVESTDIFVHVIDNLLIALDFQSC